MKRSSTTYNRVKVTGGNSINFINNCVALGIQLNNINRTSSKEFIFDVSDKDYKKITSVDNRGCNISTIAIGGKKRLLNAFIYRIGLVAGIIISIVGMLILNNRLIQIHILGLTMTSEEMVVESLEKLGVTKFSYMDYDTKKLESELSKDFNFSLVSIVIKGNSLIVNIKEELPDLENSYSPITADYNMVINSINVYSGTPKVKIGDIVYKGDILVEPYIQKGDDIVYVSPIADIEAKVFFSNSYVFKNSEDIFVRTGKKEVVLLEFKLGRYILNCKSKTTSFVLYETENVENNVSNYFLPILIKKTYVYELEKKTITRNFDEEKDSIIDRQKDTLYKSIPKNIEIKNEEINVTPINDGYIVNIYLMSVVDLKYN